MKVAVIGAGWAGIAAAVEFAARGADVTLLDAARIAGGRARRVEFDGMVLDNGQHILIGAYVETLALMRRVGADPDRLLLRLPLELRYADGFHLRAPALPAPLHLVAALFGARGLGLRRAFAAVRMMHALKSAGWRVHPDISVATLLDRHRQDELLCSHLWEPLCVSALNTPAASASAAVFASVLRDSLAGSRAASDLLVPCTDLGALLPEPAIAWLRTRGARVEPGAAVRRIARESASRRGSEHGGFRLDGRDELHDAVVLAVAPQHARALLEFLPGTEAACAALDGFGYQPIATAYLQYPAGTALPAPMLGFTGGLVQWAFDRGGLGGPDGLIAVLISAEGPHLELAREALVVRLADELAPVLAGRPRPLASRLIVEKRATFACTPGLARPDTASGVPGLVLAGDYVASDYPGTLESAVRSGLAAARYLYQK